MLDYMQPDTPTLERLKALHLTQEGLVKQGLAFAFRLVDGKVLIKDYRLCDLSELKEALTLTQLKRIHQGVQRIYMLRLN